MAKTGTNKVDHQDLLEEAFCEYLRRVDAGEDVDRQAFVSRYPDVADVLAEHLNADSVVRRMAGPTYAEATAHGEIDATITGDAPIGEGDIEDADSGSNFIPAGRSVAEQDTVIASQSNDTHPSGEARQSDIPAQFGRYQVEKLLGQGAMGSVHLAHDMQLDRRVALKIPKFDRAADADMLERFYREARAVATLHHPNICPVYDVGEIDGQTFLSMAYIEGRPLSDYTKSQKKQGERSVAKLVMKLARALQEAHEIGVIHRDLKPANIMVGKKGEPVVMDFGLARRMDSNDTRVTKSGTIVGTPAYMSPEQVEGDPDAVGPGCDQFSLGVILYEMLAGQLPFQGTMLSVIGQIAHKTPRRIEELRPDVDPRLAAICGRMMSKNPTDRFQNMAAAADALHQYLTESKSGVSAEVSQWDVVPADQPLPSKPRRRTVTTSTASIAKQSAKRSHHHKRHYPPPWQIWTAVSVLFSVAILAAVVLFLQMPEGIVRIEITDPDTQVEFAGQTFTFDDNGAKVEVTPGKHALHVKRGSLSFTTQEFTVEKDSDVAIKVTWQDSELLAKRGDETIGRKRKPAAMAANVTQSNETTPNPNEITLVHRFEGPRDSGASSMALGVSADGRWMISAGGNEKLARLWDLRSRKSVLTLVGPPSSHNRVAISPDGKRGAFIGLEGPGAIWDLESGKVMHTMTLKSQAAAISFSPNGRRLMTASMKGVAIVWDVESGKETARHDFGGWVDACLFLDNDRALVASGDPRIWDIARDEVKRKWQTKGCSSMAVSRDFRTLATSRYDHALDTWNMDNPKHILRFIGHTQRVTSIRFLPNDRYLISGATDGRIIIWDRHTGREVARREGLGHLANTVLPLPDGRHAVSCGAWCNDSVPNPVEGDYAIRLWRLPESVWPKQEMGDTPGEHAGSKLNAGQITRAATLTGLDGGVEDVAYAGDGKSVVAVGGKEVRRWSTEDGKPLQVYRLDKAGAGINSLLPLRDGRRLVTGTAPGGQGLQLWDLQTLKVLREFPGHDTGNHILARSLSPDERLLLSSGGDSTVRLWNLETGKQLHQVDGNYASAAAFNADGTRWASANWNVVTILDVQTTEVLRRISPVGRGAISDMAFSPDGRLLLTAGKNPGGLSLHEVATGRKLLDIGVPEEVRNCAFLPDGRHFVAGCRDKTIRVWQTQSGEEVLRVTTETYATNYLAVAPDGRSLASGGGKYWAEPGKAAFDGDANIYLWRLPKSVWPQQKTNDTGVGTVGQ